MLTLYRLLFLLLPLIPGCALLTGQYRADLCLRSQGFRDDPRWIGQKNRPDPSISRTVVQDFGYSPTNHAGGETPGEMGGCISRSLTPASYAIPIPNKTLQDRLTASGKFAVTNALGNSGVLIGWFHRTSRGWRTPNSMVIRLDGNGPNYWVFFEYGTRAYGTGSGVTFEGERYQTTPSQPEPADGSVHEWSLSYDPDAAHGNGEMQLVLDGNLYRAPLRSGHKAEGASFDRFGLLNQQTSGEHMTVYLRDLVLDGVHQRFDSDPEWEGVGNRVTFSDSEIRPHHNFGYRPSTNHAGGEPGEIGGLIWRTEADRSADVGYYADEVQRLSLSDSLHASGRIAMTRAAADSAVLIGWFHSKTCSEGAPPRNFLGILIEGPSRIGHYFRPAYANVRGLGEASKEGPVLRVAARPHIWTLDYRPYVNKGQGQVVVTLDGQEVILRLKPQAAKGLVSTYGGVPTGSVNAQFDRFGILSYQRGGHHIEIFLDDLEYTVTAGE